MSLSNEITVLHNGYSDFVPNQTADLSIMKANCTCTLVRNANFNVIVDTMTPWDGDKIKDSLKRFDLVPDMIDYVISTHGHADHVGNNNLFLNAKHIVGHSISKGDNFYLPIVAVLKRPTFPRGRTTNFGKSSTLIYRDWAKFEV